MAGESVTVEVESVEVKDESVEVKDENVTESKNETDLPVYKEKKQYYVISVVKDMLKPV